MATIVEISAKRFARKIDAKDWARKIESVIVNDDNILAKKRHTLQAVLDLYLTEMLLTKTLPGHGCCIGPSSSDSRSVTVR